MGVESERYTQQDKTHIWPIIGPLTASRSEDGLSGDGDAAYQNNQPSVNHPIPTHHSRFHPALIFSQRSRRWISRKILNIFQTCCASEEVIRRLTSSRLTFIGPSFGGQWQSNSQVIVSKVLFQTLKFLFIELLQIPQQAKVSRIQLCRLTSQTRSDLGRISGPRNTGSRK